MVCPHTTNRDFVLLFNMAKPCPPLRVDVVFTASAGSDTIHIYELPTTNAEIKSRGSIFQNKKSKLDDTFYNQDILKF